MYQGHLRLNEKWLCYLSFTLHNHAQCEHLLTFSQNPFGTIPSIKVHEVLSYGTLIGVIANTNQQQQRRQILLIYSL